MAARERRCPRCAGVLDAVEPLIRADERERRDAEVEALTWELLNVRADRIDVRAKVEALPYVLTYGTAGESKRADVLALLDGVADD